MLEEYAVPRKKYRSESRASVSFQVFVLVSAFFQADRDRLAACKRVHRVKCHGGGVVHAYYDTARLVFLLLFQLERCRFSDKRVGLAYLVLYYCVCVASKLKGGARLSCRAVMHAAAAMTVDASSWVGE